MTSFHMFIIYVRCFRKWYQSQGKKCKSFQKQVNYLGRTIMDKGYGIDISNINPLGASYRNQSIDLLCKSIDWFLYEGNTGTFST